MDADYKLFQVVDPSKIKVNIKEKFAKLTLSSNKKKLEPTQDKIPGDLAASNRASRNLMDEFVMADQGVVESDTAVFINPLLRSDSSSRCSSSDNETINEDFVEMEALQISDFTQNVFDDAADRLSKRVSSLTLNISPVQLCSTEDATEAAQMDAASYDKFFPPAKPEAKQISISLSSSSCDEESVVAITISDSSQSENYDLVTSNIPMSGETGDALLPSTFSNDKADRMEAFLRDVSQTRKELNLGKIQPEKLDEVFLQNDKPLANDISLLKSHKHLATADTESMSEDFGSGLKLEHEKVQLLDDDTQPMSQTHDSFFMTESKNSTIFDGNKNDKDCGRHLAQDETVANTLLTSLNASKQPVYNSPEHFTKNESLAFDSSHGSTLPQESITILETTSEDEASPHTPCAKQNLSSSTASQTTDNINQQTMGSINISARINIKIHISQQISSDGESSDSERTSQALTNVATESNSTQMEASPDNGDDEPSNGDCAEKLASKAVASPEIVQEDVDKGFMEHAQKILNQLYGNSWQTPEVIRTLHRSRCQSNKSDVAVNRNFTADEAPSLQLAPGNNIAEESALDDFSIFRRNIKTNLDSTRTVEHTLIRGRKNIKSRNFNSETKCKTSNQNFKHPQTEVKKKSRKEKKCQGVNFQGRWRQFVDNDSDEGVNASDDNEPDKTINDDSSSDDNSDLSWSKQYQFSHSSDSSASDDCDFKTLKKNISKRHKNKNKGRNTQKSTNFSDPRHTKLVYLDLSKNEVEVLEGTPTANIGDNLKNRLHDILSSHKYEDKPRLEATSSTVKTKRKLFTPNFGNESEDILSKIDSPVQKGIEILDKENVHLNPQPMPAIFEPFNKHLEAVKIGQPIFKIQSPKTPKRTPKAAFKCTENRKITPNNSIPANKYGFLKSLDVCVGKSHCHPEALFYRDNYRLKKEELANKLYDLYNKGLFKNELEVPIIWNKKLINTAGRCLNRTRLGNRTSVIELSEKVLTSADRLRCTLIHELCHAATWILNGEGGHGATWKSWASKANTIFPEIPKIGVCHQYDIEYKYTYKCTLCAAKSHAHSKSRKVENIRCSYCHGAIEIFLNKKDKDGNIMPTPVREPTGFAKFVRDKYKEYKRPDLKHSDVMKILSNEFALLKVAKNN